MTTPEYVLNVTRSYRSWIQRKRVLDGDRYRHLIPYLAQEEGPFFLSIRLSLALSVSRGPGGPGNKGYIFTQYGRHSKLRNSSTLDGWPWASGRTSPRDGYCAVWAKNGAFIRLNRWHYVPVTSIETFSSPNSQASAAWNLLFAAPVVRRKFYFITFLLNELKLSCPWRTFILPFLHLNCRDIIMIPGFALLAFCNLKKDGST